MADDRQIYGEIDNKTNLRDVCKKIRDDVRNADDRPALTELYRRAGYLVTLSHANSWREKFGDDIGEIRSVAQEEFATTARTINRRAEEIGTDADYDESWGD
ncbi:MAG: hypothetical protein DWQ34_24110 [Planctomycetota bacterium]|nr:MAG: hypothetical protein DWQ29_12960 [Planctomycetota bacterium]REJ87733.1 MAG: hypothetical protein DWQ34_24110 [Planctomycetota bacterium]REK27816.1 MAG: hypothetical protein DWQ41_06860 [Planctomycetota bacterium]REK40270.1 MAG: hypothetical protein DWQ45_00100 [Planctomycetota bacterium]